MMTRITAVWIVVGRSRSSMMIVRLPEEEKDPYCAARREAAEVVVVGEEWEVALPTSSAITVGDCEVTGVGLALRNCNDLEDAVDAAAAADAGEVVGRAEDDNSKLT